MAKGRHTGGRKPRLNKKNVTAALEAHNGLVSHAARHLAVHPSALYRFFEKYPEMKDIRDSAREAALDDAENRLAQAAYAGEPWAVTFLLKTLGKSRGYSERQEHTGDGGGPITFTLKLFDNPTTREPKIIEGSTAEPKQLPDKAND